MGIGSLSTPPPFSALPPANMSKASPRAISGRTSYIRVRLEFLRYPHVIRQLFNGGRFGPPLPFTATSTWSWIGHPVSGLLHATSRALDTRFPCGSDPEDLNLAAYSNSPDHSTKGTTSRLNALCVLVNIRFQVLFHSVPTVLFTFPSRYFFSIGHQVVFRLGGWSPRLPRGFLVSARTLDAALPFPVSPTGLSPSLAGLPRPFDYSLRSLWRSQTPHVSLHAVWPPPLSLATTRGISVDFFSSPYLDVSVREVPRVTLWIHVTLRGSSPRGFPHSEICGSTFVCNSPQLIAAGHVLLRLLMPRHSPYALLSLNFCKSSFRTLLFSFSNCCDHHVVQLLGYFSHWQNCFTLPLLSWKDLILHQYLFPK